MNHTITLRVLNDLVKTPKPTHAVFMDGGVVAVCFSLIHAQVVAKLLQEWVDKPTESRTRRDAPVLTDADRKEAQDAGERA